nr:unnamed protein product [Callosobruchus chinensis]
MDILRIFRMTEPVSKDLLSKKEELGQYKEVVQEEDVLLKNHRARIKELENEIAELKNRNVKLENDSRIVEESRFQKVMGDYDELFHKIWNEREHLLTKNETLERHIQNLEESFSNLLDKFAKARMLTENLMDNQEIMEGELAKYQDTIRILEEKYNCLKAYSEGKIAEANSDIEAREKGNIQEVAMLKARILQSQAKINELEKYVKFEDISKRQSMFEPLKNNIAKF